MTGWSASTRRSELPPDWRAIRRRVLERDGWLCVFCGAAASQADHVDDPNDHSEDNLRSLCEPCHNRRTQAQAQAARRGRPTRRRPDERHPGLLW